MAAIPFSTMFQSFSDANEKEWKYDRTLSLGASEVFGCIRKAFFKKFGYEPDDGYAPDWGAAKRGDMIENHFAVPAVKSVLPEGAELLMAGDIQETFKKGRLSATPDGLIDGLDFDALAELGIEDIESDCIVTEFKSFDPRATVNQEKAIHAGQTQVQMGLIHELTEFRPEYAVIIYFNASFLSDIRCFVVKRDPKIYTAAKERAKRVYQGQEPTEFMAEGKISGECDMCEFTEECALAQGLSTPREKKPILDEAILHRLEVLAGRQRELAGRMTEDEKDKRLVDEEIKEILRDNQTKGAGNENFSVSLSWMNGKKSLDRLAMEADGIDTKAYEKEGNGFDRLLVKIKK